MSHRTDTGASMMSRFCETIPPVRFAAVPVRGASCVKKKPRHLLSKSRNERGILRFELDAHGECYAPAALEPVRLQTANFSPTLRWNIKKPPLIGGGEYKESKRVRG